MTAPLRKGLGQVLRPLAHVLGHFAQVLGPRVHALARLMPPARRRELARQGTTRYGFGMGLALYLVITLAVLGNSVVHPTASFPGYGGDAEQYMWYLGWFWHAVGLGHNPFVTSLLNYPYGMNLMWNTSIVAESLLLGPLAAFVGTAAMYNLWFLLNFVLAGVLGQAILGRLGARQWLGIVGGLLVVTLPYLDTQALSHISLLTIELLLGLLLVLIKLIQDKPRRAWFWGVLAGLLLAMQFYTLLEVLVSATLTFILTLIVAWFAARQDLLRLLRRMPVSAVVAAVITAGVLAMPGVFEMLFGPYRVFNSVQPPNTYVVDLVNLILPTHAFLVHFPGTDPAAWFTGNYAEDNGYLGIPALLLLNWAIRRLWHRPLVRVLALVAGIVTLLALGHSLHLLGWPSPLPLPWAAFSLLPFIKDLLPARFMLYTDLAVVAISVLAVEDYLRHGGTGAGNRPYWLLGLMVATWLPVLPYPNTTLPQASVDMVSTSTIARALRNQPTYVLTVAFPETMQMLQLSDYSFPVANVYGHNSNTIARQQQLQGVQVLMNPNLAPEIYQTILVDDLMRLHVTRLYFLPRPNYGASTLPQEALRQINAALGPPIAASPTGSIVWRVPKAPVFDELQQP